MRKCLSSVCLLAFVALTWSPAEAQTHPRAAGRYGPAITFAQFIATYFSKSAPSATKAAGRAVVAKSSAPTAKPIQTEPQPQAKPFTQSVKEGAGEQLGKESVKAAKVAGLYAAYVRYCENSKTPTKCDEVKRKIEAARKAFGDK